MHLCAHIKTTVFTQMGLIAFLRKKNETAEREILL